jgi:malate dehydrogenase (oxaloacetate-decarboxylating)
VATALAIALDSTVTEHPIAPWVWQTGARETPISWFGVRRTAHPTGITGTAGRARRHLDDTDRIRQQGLPQMALDMLLPEPDDGRLDDPVFAMHAGGKMAITSTVALNDRADLSLAYTPGVARVCEAIAEDPSIAHDYTWVGNAVAVVTDGTAVLGLGDIGPAAAMPVMEGKALLFKKFGGVDAVPICLDTADVDQIVETVVRLAPSFGGINLEDISAPRCFEIERRLQDRLNIPVFHDDQHGTAVVVLAALRSALILTGRTVAGTRVVISGAGAAGVAVARILLAAGVTDLQVVDRGGVLHRDRTDLNPVKLRLAEQTNPKGASGRLADALVGADVFVGVSGGSVPEEAIAHMADDAVVFALANPVPEIHPDIAHRHAAVVATGRSDYPNQINNVLAFPGIFRGALDVRARLITEGMKLAAADALAGLVQADLRPECIIPTPFDERIPGAVSVAVAEAARRDGVARR